MRKEVFINPAKQAVTVILRRKGFKGVGVAKCNTAAGDKFDEEFGIELAEARAKVAFQKARRSEFQEEAKMIKSVLKAAENKVMDISEAIDQSELKVAQILKKAK